jgi:hypothetical protein
VISPLLANVYVHYAFDLWVNVWREKWAHGEVAVIRYADDIILGFQHQADTDRFLENLRAIFPMASQSAGPGGERNQERPYVPLSHPFVERLIGTIRRECLDHTLFWTSADLENKLLDFRTYYNHHRTHHSREGRTPDTPASPPVANLGSFRWQVHCRGLCQTPVAA